MVTSRLFEAHLACRTKCFLRVGDENSFAGWTEQMNEAYGRVRVELCAKMLVPNIV